MSGFDPSMGPLVVGISMLYSVGFSLLENEYFVIWWAPVLPSAAISAEISLFINVSL